MNEKKKKIEPYVTIVVKTNNNQLTKLKRTLESLDNQTFKSFEIIILTKNGEKEIKKICKDYEKIKMVDKKDITIEEIIKVSSKNSNFFTLMEAGEILTKTYIETSILALQLNEDYWISYTDTRSIDYKKEWNYYFENNILYNNRIPVPNLVFNRKVMEDIKENTIEELRTWKTTAKLVKKYKAIHQSYYGFITDKEETDLTEENYSQIERELNQCDIIDYPYENYYYQIIKSRINQLKIIPHKKEKTNILLIIPWMVVGGADRFNLDFVKLINHEKYEVTIITDHPKEYIWRDEFEKYADEVFEMASFLARKDIPTFIEYIVETRNIDLVLVTNSMIGYNLIPYIRLKYPKLPVIDYIHCIELYNRDGGYGRDSSMLTSLIDKTLFCSKDAEISCNEIFGIDKNKTNTVYIGVDSHKYERNEKDAKEIRREYQLEEFFTVGYICRIDYQKRPFLLLEIMKKTILRDNNIKFIIGGDGPLLKNLKEKVEEYELNNNVLFLGNVTNTKKFYSMCDITINCSIKEGLALTAYESLSMQVPIVSANVGGHKELIDSSCGIIVPLLQEETEILNFEYQEEEIMPYVDAIFKIKKDIHSYQENCRDRIVQKFSLEKMIINMEKEISSTIKNPNKEVLENAKALVKNERIVYEYLSHYLMGSQYEHQTLINQYRNRFKPIIIEENQENELDEEKAEENKMDFQKEIFLIKDFIKSILKIILFIPRLLLIEIKRIIGRR